MINSEPFFYDKVILKASEAFCEKGSNKSTVYYYYEHMYWYKIVIHFNDM